MAKHAVVLAFSIICFINRSRSAPLVKASGVQWSEPKGAGKGNITLIMMPHNGSAGNDSDMIVAVKSDYQILSQDTQLLNLVVSENKHDSDDKQNNQFQSVQQLSKETCKKDPEKEYVKNPDTAKYFEPEKKISLDATNNSVDIYPALLKNYQAMVSGASTLATPGIRYSSVNVLQFFKVSKNDNPNANSDDKTTFSLQQSNESNFTVMNDTANIKEKNLPVNKENVVVEGGNANITLSMVNPNKNFLNEALSILEKLKRDPSYYDKSKGNHISIVEGAKDQSDSSFAESKTKYLKRNGPAVAFEKEETQGGEKSNDVASLQDEINGNFKTSDATSCIPFFMPFTNEPSTDKPIDLQFQKGVAFESIPINPIAQTSSNASQNNNIVEKLFPEKSASFENASYFSDSNLNKVTLQAREESSELINVTTECSLSIISPVLDTRIPQRASMEQIDLLKLITGSITVDKTSSQANSNTQAQFESNNLFSSNASLSSGFNETVVSLQQYRSFKTTECAPLFISLFQAQPTKPQQSKMDTNDIVLTSTECPSSLEILRELFTSPQQAKVEPDALKQKTNCSPTFNISSNFFQATNAPQQAKLETEILELNSTTGITGQTTTAVVTQFKSDLIQTTACITVPSSNFPPINLQTQQPLLQANVVGIQPNVVVDNGNSKVTNQNNTSECNYTGNIFSSAFTTVPTTYPIAPSPIMQENNNLHPGVGAAPKKITLEPAVNCLTLQQRKIERNTSENNQQRQDIQLPKQDFMLPLVESSVFLANNNDISKGKDIPISLHALNASLDEFKIPDSQEQDDIMHDKVAYLYSNNNPPLGVNVDSSLGSDDFSRSLVITGRRMVKTKPSLNKEKILSPDINNILKMHFAGKNGVLESKLSYRAELDKINCNKTNGYKNSKAGSESDDYENQDSSSSSTGVLSGSGQLQINIEPNTTMKQLDLTSRTDADEGIPTILSVLETSSTQVYEDEVTQAQSKQITESNDHSTKRVSLKQCPSKASYLISKSVYEDNIETTTDVINFEYSGNRVSAPVKEITLNNDISTKRKLCNKPPIKTLIPKSSKVTSRPSNKCVMGNTDLFIESRKSNQTEQVEQNEQKVFVPGDSVQKIVIEIVTNTKKPTIRPEKFQSQHRKFAPNIDVQNLAEGPIDGFPIGASSVEYKKHASDSKLDNGPHVGSTNIERLFSNTGRQHLLPLKNDFSSKEEAVNDYDYERQNRHSNVLSKQMAKPIHPKIFKKKIDIPTKSGVIHEDPSSGANVGDAILAGIKRINYFS